MGIALSRIMQPKVFISHKREDSDSAEEVRKELEKNQVNAYLDLLDPELDDDAKMLTEHLKKKMNQCSDLLVVMSKKTQKSWWVPFEIGMAAHKDLPTVTYITEFVEIPEYLSFWQYLNDLSEIRLYAESVKKRCGALVKESRALETRMFNMDAYSQWRNADSTNLFYENLGKTLEMSRIRKKYR